MTAYISDNEKDCWQLLREGQARALGYFYDTYVDILFQAALRVTANREMAKDALQEVFVEIWQYRATIGDIRHTQSYLIRVLRNILFKKMRSEIFINSIPEHDNISSPDENAEELIISQDTGNENSRRLQHAVSQLTKRQKEILELRFNQGLSYDQIAGRLDMNYQSVNNLAFRTLRRLRLTMSALFL